MPESSKRTQYDAERQAGSQPIPGVAPLPKLCLGPSPTRTVGSGLGWRQRYVQMRLAYEAGCVRHNGTAMPPLSQVLHVACT